MFSPRRISPRPITFSPVALAGPSSRSSPPRFWPAPGRRASASPSTTRIGTQDGPWRGGSWTSSFAWSRSSRPKDRPIDRPLKRGVRCAARNMRTASSAQRSRSSSLNRRRASNIARLIGIESTSQSNRAALFDIRRSLGNLPTSGRGCCFSTNPGAPGRFCSSTSPALARTPMANEALGAASRANAGVSLGAFAHGGYGCRRRP
jgi:hypothetical protein